MNDSNHPVSREVVGILSDRAQFERTIAALKQAGFDTADLSVLTSHESIDAAGKPGKSWRDSLVGLVGELRYEGPLVAAGLIALAAGPVGAAIAGLVAAGVGGAAAKELLDEVSAQPHSEDFARALEAGSVILWVYAPDPLREGRAKTILAENGATNIHVNDRKTSTL
ncbi:hypothetical protein [Telmatospirillum sp. J64-1]|uniref:hypothetical protein n=1 Tax=Telmatospirillum sp. J64-1 TaxID=2502183 RepID=UPI00115C71EE|nr:hypothetical protein [Telmatospirillum sp. J64-1]